jgi:YegS/Rv2252/BmrU family lipid kinase
MQKVALLYNPDSGGRRKRRESELESLVKLFRAEGVDATLILTDSREHAEEKTRQAVLAGCDTVFAAGGDGTIHNIIQVLANTSVALAVLPMGTANALAHDLNLPMNVIAAGRMLLKAKSRRVALGRIQYRNFDGNADSRYFVIAAGVGVDAHLFYKLVPGTKRRLGMAAYYYRAWHLWFTYAMTRFHVEYVEPGAHDTKQAELTELLGVRIRSFGGVLKELAPGASLDRGDMRLILCRTSNRLAFLLYVAGAFFRRQWSIPGIDLAYASRVVCESGNQANDSPSGDNRRIYVEADGELLGTLPAEITVLPDALTILTPSV